MRVVDNLSTGKLENLAAVLDDIEFVRADLRDEAVCRRAVRGADVVFHVAALPSVPRSLADPWTCHDSNVNATLRSLCGRPNACNAKRLRRPQSLHRLVRSLPFPRLLRLAFADT
ncbi:MAG: NAD-dependent epimerase/dehydratase family protein [Deltaproteobacteria bacterium]|nr:MAG: NAD-dependent epimerase/dehydratase family protein [Deltaproteobacteria bacterium]